MKFSGYWTLPNTPYDKYNAILDRSLSEPDIFSIFRGHGDYIAIVGCDTHGESAATTLVEVIDRFYPELLPQLEDFRKNDSIGEPPLFVTRFGNFSSNTLRYVTVLGDLNKFFGSLENKSIVEIGSAYGGQCFIIYQQHKFKSYTLIDIPNSVELSRKYLSNFLIENVIYQDSENVESTSSDLCISNFAFTELDYGGCDFYIDNIISKSNNFYITTNLILPSREINQEKFDYLYNRLSEFFDIEFHDEPPLEHTGTGVWVGRRK